MGIKPENENLIEIKERALPQLIENGGYKSILHRPKEEWYSISIKLLGNLFFTVIQILNLPFFIVGFLAILESIIKYFIPTFSIGNFINNFSIYLLWAVAIWFVVEQLVKMVKSNMVSSEIDLIWALNFKKGKIQNPFYSIELQEKYTNNLSQVVAHNLQRIASVREKKLMTMIERQHAILQHIKELSKFPEETMRSFSRMTEIIVNPVLEKQTPRHTYEVTMDSILSQIINLKYFKGTVTQGTIMLLENDTETNEQILSIVGQSDMSLEHLGTKKVKVGEKFAGKVLEGGELVYIEDIYSPEAEKYGYGPNISKNKSYNGIMGMPIRKPDGEGYKTIGVINLHFINMPEYNEQIRIEIEKTLDVFSHFIVCYLKIKERMDKVKENVENI